MIFNEHSNLKGQHAFLSPSKYHWINYDDEKVAETYRTTVLAVKHGIKLHAFAADCVLLGQKLPRSSKTLNQYVNDCIGFHMATEQPLYYSENCFGTADAICYRDKVLRIHDLKTGETPAHMEQLEVYAALFCLEYNIKPSTITIILRLYQGDSFTELSPAPEIIEAIMDKIVRSDRIICHVRETEE